MRPALKRLAIKIDPTFSSLHHRAQREACGAVIGLLPSIAIAWSIGSVVGLLVTSIGPTTWLLAAIFIALAALVVSFLPVRPGHVLLLACFVCVASARAALDRTTVTPANALLTPFADGRIVNVRGTVSSEPIHLDIRVGRLERFGHVPEPVAFDLSDARVSWAGSPRLSPIGSLRIFVRNEGDSAVAFRIGDQICLRGRLRSSRAPTNPNVAPPQTSEPYVDVPGVQLISVLRSHSAATISTLNENIAAWRFLVCTGLDTALSDHASPRARALVRAIVLGIRTKDFDRISEPYRRTGLAHYLAVSGFALGVLIAIPALLLSMSSPLLRGIVVTIVVVLGMLAIDLRAPALRAGVVACAVALGNSLGRDWDRRGLLALAALILLLIDPSEILRAGFQLSFAVVAALLLLAPVLARRLPIPIALNDGRLRSLLLSWLRTALACGVVAWGTATPIVLYHFGIISPAGVLLSILAAPLVVVIVAFSIAAVVTAIVLPGLALIPGSIAAWSAHLLDTATVLCAQLPGACLVLPSPSFLWMIFAEIVLWRWVLHVRPAERTLLVASTLVLIGFLLVAPTRTTPPDALELLTLDVGNGTCHIVTGPTGSVLVDSGSSSFTSCAHKVVLPALRERGIGYLDAVLITHANLDHFAAVGDLLSRIPIGAVFIGESFMNRAQTDPNGPAAEFLDLADLWHIPVHTVVSGESRSIGGLRWRFIHPDDGAKWKLENDSSLVVRVEHLFTPTSEPAAILFTGDIEEQAMHHLLEHKKRWLAARVLEAPHHGSVRKSTRAFISSVDPELIVQSSGPRRLKRDELRSILQGRMRVATALSGAIHIRQIYRGASELKCFRDSE